MTCCDCVIFLLNWCIVVQSSCPGECVAAAELQLLRNNHRLTVLVSLSWSLLQVWDQRLKITRLFVSVHLIRRRGLRPALDRYALQNKTIKTALRGNLCEQMSHCAEENLQKDSELHKLIFLY